jgi:mannose-6-phosphate isomerase-like protein (cupin superfamily)
MGNLSNACMLAPALIFSSLANAQSAKVDHYSKSELLDQAKVLEQRAVKTGSAGGKLEQYPNHFTMLTLRKRSGGAEVHQEYADIFVVVRGHATLLSGGTVDAPKVVSPGETQGTSVQGGTSTVLHEGDLVHIPAGMPHQLSCSRRMKNLFTSSSKYAKQCLRISLRSLHPTVPRNEVG